MHFQLEVTGVGGVYTATLSSEGTQLERWNPSSVKQARKDAKAFAKRYKEDNLPSRLESYDENFAL